MNLNPNFRPSLISHTRCTSKLEFVENVCFEINCETKITRSSYRLPFYKTLSGIKCSDGNELGNTNPAPDTHCVRKALFLHVKVNETGLNASRNSNLRSSWSWKYSDYWLSSTSLYITTQMLLNVSKRRLICSLKGQYTQKWKFSHHLLTLK